MFWTQFADSLPVNPEVLGNGHHAITSREHLDRFGLLLVGQNALDRRPHPSTVSIQSIDRAPMNAEDIRSFLLCNAAGEQFIKTLNLTLGEDRAFIPANPPACVCHVLHVVSVRAQLEMGWVYAPWVMTTVEDEHSFRDHSTMVLVGKAMS